MFNSDAEIDHIGRGLIDCSLPKAEWTHAAHFAAALWLLSHEDYDAYADMPGFIRRYNDATGGVNSDHEGYHETITLASLRAADHRLLADDGTILLYEKVNALLASKFGQPGWIFDYWTRDRLFSVKARRDWTEPDIQPLPF